MAFKIFLSYSTDPDEQSIVWRIQTLAAAQGIQIFVPQRAGFKLPSAPRNVPLLNEQIRNAIDQSDCVVAIITSGTGAAVQKELNYALGKGKPIIPIVEQGVADHSFLGKFPAVFRFSRLDPSPGRVETEVSQFLAKQKLDKDTRQAVGAIVAVGIGLLLLAGLSKA
jgi:nucleoside 2-deoxyribosyltransferase